MSNQKPPPSVVQQTRYPTPTTFLSRPPTPRADAAFHVTQQQPYVQPPPNQTGNQGPTIRAMAPTGPPNQSSTPPNSDLKVSQMSQSMNLAFVQPVRGTNQSYFGRPPPQNQPPRMPNHRISNIQGQQPVFPPQSSPFIQPMAPVQPIYCYYGSSGQRTMVPQYYPGQTFATISYPQNPQPSQTYVNYQPQYLPRSHQQQVVASAPQNLQQVPPQPMALTQATQQQQGQKKRRAKAIPIIDPESGKDKLDEIYVNSDYNPPSGESSARQTPQPHYIPNKEVQSTFTKQVNMVINQEKMDEVEHSSSPSLDQHIDTQSMYHLPCTQAVHISNRNDLVQSSKLLPPTKEFVPAGQHTNTAKEATPTPVVSANVVTAEVTINKQNRESPVKSRKQREPQLTKEIKEPPVVLEKKEEQKIAKEEFKIKEPTSPPPTSAVTLTTKDVKDANNQREEKKVQKKDKVEQEKSLSPSPEIVLETISQPNVLLLAPVQENGKSKQRNKDVQKQQTQAPSPPQVVPVNNKQNTPIPVPQSQPAKPNNKSSKMRELNMKGANKEGTDMDAFNDNALSIDTVVVTNTAICDTINTNDIINNINDSNKKIESNEVPTIKSENKTFPKKVDVTDIVKDIPKPYIAPVEPCDETDRVEYDNDKIVQAKNEVNIKVTTENDTNAELRPSLPYKDDQWSPSNIDGKKIYDRDFLMALRNDPKSRKKPDNLLDIIAQEDRGRIGDINRYPMGGKPTDFAPNFSGSNYSAKSMPQRNTLPNKRNSQQGKSGGNSKGVKSSNVIRSLSVRGDVKLNESENAWKPARFISSANMSDDEKKTQELYKKVRGVLNKLTPQKFDTLLVQVRGLTIDTKERLQGVIDLVFEKAVDEPNFSVAYANMCKELALMQVPVSTKREGESVVNFRKLLVTRCQMEFEKNSSDETARNIKIKEIEECTDPEKKKELQLLLEEDDRRLRRKSVGNIRFIGELFKQQMLTVNIMLRCLNHLLDNKEEESLECLCKLLSTVGKEVEEKKVDLNPIFLVIREIVDKKHGRISSRVRFMLQDVIDLRNCKWIPRRQDFNPKTIDQIQKEANDEQLTIQAMNAVPLAPRKEERSTPGSGAGKRGTRNTSDPEGWSTASSRGRAQQFTVQSDKLKNKVPQIDEPLGNSQMFGTWVRGANIKPATPTSANMFAALENIGNDIDKRSPMNYSSKDPYHSKGTSLERPNYKHTFEDGRGSRSGSQHRSHDNSQRLKPMPTPQQNLPKSIPPVTPKPRQPPVEQLSSEQSDQLQRQIKNILEEYLNDCYTVNECDEDIRTSLPPSALPQLVSDSYICVLERSRTARLGSGTLFAHLIKLGTLSVDNYCIGVEEVLSQADDLTIDIPKIWDYLAEIIAPIVNENAVSLIRLHKSFDIIIRQGHASKLLDPLFKLVIAEKGPNYLHTLWQNSGLSFSDFMPSSQANSFIQENKLEFLLGGINTIGISQTELTYEQIHNKLLEFFANENLLDDIFVWIEANIGERANEKQFVRTLATAVFEDSIVKSKLKTENLRKQYSLLIRIIDGRLDYELECLYALQALINKLEHPQGILLSICGALYDDNIFSHDSFVKWEASDNPAEQEGKGVALKQLTSFFTQLKEADEETSSTEDA